MKVSSPAVTARSATTADFVVIRGRKLDLNALYDARLLQPENVAAFAARFAQAQPFAHLAIDGLFNPDLLTLMEEEFDLYGAASLKPNLGGHEAIYRAESKATMGPATKLYFGLVHSPLFLAFCEQVSGEAQLIADVSLRNGGYHETRQGGRFDVHLDFHVDTRSRLINRLVFITYLNKNWDEAWGGHLELWTKEACAARVAPLFGRTLLMRHSAISYHGHPQPLACPPERKRRSVCCYYYVHPAAREPLLNDAKYSRFLNEETRGLSATKLKNALQLMTPPLLWNGIKALSDKARGR